MCLGIPMKVVEINGNIAVAELQNIKRKVRLDLLEGVIAGDFVLIHAGYAIQKLDVEEAEKTLSLLREVFRDEAGI